MGADNKDVKAEQDVKVGRRNFLKGAALGGVAAVAAPVAVTGAQAAAGVAPTAAPRPADPNAPRPTGPVSNAEESSDRPDGLTYDSCGGDYMVDVIRSLDIEYFAAVPGNTFMGLHEAVINYGMLSEPKLTFITNMHEEASVAMCHGYAKIEGKPMACMFHTTVGTQHASMAIYNAYADRVPIFMMTGCSIDQTRRPSAVDWVHAAMDGPAMVRDFTKWDDTPGSLRAFGDGAVRAYKFAMTPPCGPVLLAVDTLMQEDEIPGGKTAAPPIPKYVKAAPPQAEAGALRETARLLVTAESPVIFADRCARTPAGLRLLTELAETLQAPVIDSSQRMNFPWRHPLNGSRRQGALITSADFLLELEPSNPFDLTTARDARGNTRSIMKAGSKRATISSVDLFMKSNYQDFQRFASDIDLPMAGDAETSLPFLIEEVKRQLPADRRSALEARGQRLAQAAAADLGRSKAAAAFGWDDSPISTARMYSELYNLVQNEDWSLVSASDFQSRWPQQLWKGDKHYQYIGGHGAAGIGYLAPAGLGAALANRKHGRLSISVVGDGDLMFGPGILWTAAHEKIPILYIVHNNRGYHMEIMQMQVISNRRQRGADRVRIGCEITDPNIDYAAMAKGIGVYAEGPIENPRDLGPALQRALAVVKKGEPALIDIVSQPR